MKIQTKTTWQKRLVFTAIASMVFIFAASSLTYAQVTYGNEQATYKVGDRVESLSAGTWYKAEIIEVRAAGEYVIRFDNGESGSSRARYLRPIKADAPANQNNTGGQTQDPTNGNTQGANGGIMAAPHPGNSVRERFGSRDPRTCADQKAPARGAITAAFAKKYFICKAEAIQGNLLYLVENLRLEVGGGVPYTPNLGAFQSINVRVPLYPIRGSLLRYQCADLVREHVGPPDTNCHTYNEPKATGYCYKTTFGDWSCYMSDPAGINNENQRTGIAPPKP